MSKKGALVGLAAAGILGVGIAVPAIAFAEGAQPSTSASPTASASSNNEKPRWEQRREERRNAMAEALAAELGVDKERVAAALEKVHEQMRPEAGARREGRGRPDSADREKWAAERKAQLTERLNQAVEDGKLTREQADAILKAVEAGVLPGPGWGAGRAPR